MMTKIKMISITIDVDNETDAVSFHALFHLILTRILWNRYFPYPPFTEVEPDRWSWGGSKGMKLIGGRVEI